jgi:hypothetical protein
MRLRVGAKGVVLVEGVYSQGVDNTVENYMDVINKQA